MNWRAILVTAIAVIGLASEVHAGPLVQAKFPNEVFWGDSLTAGTGATGSGQYPTVVAVSGARPRWFFNGGVGGNTSTQVAVRQGGVATTATISGGQIPASGGVTVTFPVGFEPVTTQGPANGVNGTISGVYGVVTLAASVYTFTRSAAGSIVNISSAQFIPDVSFSAANIATQVLWAGRNNYASSAQVLSDMAGMVATSGTRYAVLSVLNGEYTSEHSGQSSYNQIIALDASLSAAYSPNYIDVRSALVAAYNPANTMDVADFAADVPPFTLRANNVNGTLTQAIAAGDTSFTTDSTFAAGYVLLIDSEYIYVTSVSGTTITACTRGYGGSTAASHSNTTAIAGTDPLHLNNAGYAIVASNVYAKIAANGW